jgi:hypothetical protein
MGSKGPCLNKWQTLRSKETLTVLKGTVTTVQLDGSGRNKVHSKGLAARGTGVDFYKNHRTSFFYEDLSNEPNLGRIHLAGQYL